MLRDRVRRTAVSGSVVSSVVNGMIGCGVWKVQRSLASGFMGLLCALLLFFVVRRGFRISQMHYSVSLVNLKEVGLAPLSSAG